MRFTLVVALCLLNAGCAVVRADKEEPVDNGPKKPTAEPVLKPDILQKVWILRKLLYPMDELEAMEFLLDKVKASKTNSDFFDSMRRG